MECYSSLLNLGALAADGLHRADLRLRERRNAADKKRNQKEKQAERKSREDAARQHSVRQRGLMYENQTI